HEDFFAPLPHLSALLVEPYPFTRLALSQTLKQWGIQVAAFADFASAQEAYTSGAYHLAVCGLAPTEALGGDFTKWIHWLYQQQLPTLFLCSNAERVEAALATLPSFPHAVLNKPATRPGLHSQITALMNQQAQPPTAPASTNQPLLLERTNGAPLQVLAVDDHPTNLHLVTTFLQQAGIKVHTTTNGRSPRGLRQTSIRFGFYGYSNALLRWCRHRTAVAQQRRRATVAYCGAHGPCA